MAVSGENSSVLPREILPGGYISWVDPQTATMEQILWVDPKEKPIKKTLGPAPPNMSLRQFVENQTYRLAFGKRTKPSKADLAERKLYRNALKKAAVARAKHYV